MQARAQAIVSCGSMTSPPMLTRCNFAQSTVDGALAEEPLGHSPGPCRAPSLPIDAGEGRGAAGGVGPQLAVPVSPYG